MQKTFYCLKATKDGKDVYHTGSLSIDDWRVIKIKRVLLPRSRRILV